MLKTADIIDDSSKEDEVGINNTVEVYVEEDDETETYRIVTSIRGDALSGLVSIESPIGKALMGKRVGDRVSVQVNDSYSYDVIIKKIIKTNDDTNDKIRQF